MPKKQQQFSGCHQQRNNMVVEITGNVIDLLIIQRFIVKKLIGENMDVKITKKDAFNIIGLQLTGITSNQEIPGLWDQLSDMFDNIKPLVKTPVMAYGVCDNFDMKQKTFDYMAGIEVENFDRVPDKIKTKELPSQEYAVFETTLPTIMDTIKKIYSDWLPTSEYKRADGPEFEEYDPDFDPSIPESTLLLYIPVEKK